MGYIIYKSVWVRLYLLSILIELTQSKMKNHIYLFWSYYANNYHKYYTVTTTNQSYTIASLTVSFAISHVKYCLKTEIPEELQKLNKIRKLSIAIVHNIYMVRVRRFIICLLWRHMRSLHYTYETRCAQNVDWVAFIYNMCTFFCSRKKIRIFVCGNL